MERGDSDIGRCDFIDALEAAVVGRRRVHVELIAGDRFVDTPNDVVTEGGEDFAVFAAHGRVSIREIHAVADAGPRVI